MAIIQKNTNRTIPRPVLKWAGGKQQFCEILEKHKPLKYNKYIEPFFGGGAFFFFLKPDYAIISDSNPELINLYNTIKSNPEEVISSLKKMINDKNIFYEVRSQNYDSLSNIEKAVRTIYLNKTAFNGLYRVNKNGEFNVPYGYYKNPLICDEKNIIEVQKLIKNVEIILGDYKEVLKTKVMPGDFIYLDPPYLPISEFADFKRYTKIQFCEKDHYELANEVHRLHDLGCYLLITNSNHPLIHELFKNYKIEVFDTKRTINCDASKRTGEDILITVEPKQNKYFIIEKNDLPEQFKLFPPTRFMGSKQKIVKNIWEVASKFQFDSVLDLFCGSSVVSYMFKCQGKKVFTNDYMMFTTRYAKAVIENNSINLKNEDIELLLKKPKKLDNFVSSTFKDLYFTDEDNRFIDYVRTNISKLTNQTKKDIAISALVRSCIKKRARGIFTFTGFRYDDGRNDLRLSLREHFLNSVKQINSAIFDNGKQNSSRYGDALETDQNADLVYIDPPYYSPLSDNEYVRRYHFVEGLARDWEGLEIQDHTTTKKFKSYPTPFNTYKSTYDALSKIIQLHKDSILVISYSSNSLPTKEEILDLLAETKKHVEVICIDHNYSFGNQAHKVNNVNNKVQEYLFVGY
jgi:DNA adenine methylase